MRKNHILKTTAQNCVNCQNLNCIYEKNKTITEMERKYTHMDYYSTNHAFKCTNNKSIDEDMRKLIITLSFAGKNIICHNHSSKVIN